MTEAEAPRASFFLRKLAFAVRTKHYRNILTFALLCKSCLFSLIAMQTFIYPSVRAP